MEPDEVIHISEIIAPNLVTRRAADGLMDFVKTNSKNKVIIDFKYVEFASRSFVHEYLMRKEGINKKITEKNVSVQVRKMFKLVSKEGNRNPTASVTSFKSMPLSAKNL